MTLFFGYLGCMLLAAAFAAWCAGPSRFRLAFALAGGALLLVPVGDLFDVIDVRRAIERAIAALPEPHHTILVLVDLEDHSYEEAAAILEVPVGTVRSRLFRARRMIQESLIAYAEDAGVARRPPRESRADAPTL